MNSQSSKIISKCLPGYNIGPITNITSDIDFKPITLGSVSIDLSKLCSPKVLITFSGELNDSVRTVTQQIFRVIKTCNGVRKQISGNLGAGRFFLFTSKAFQYQVCDCSCSCNPCDCVTYTVELIPGVVSAAETITISNFFISAYASEEDNQTFNCAKGNELTFVSSGPPPTNTPITLTPLDIGSITIDACGFNDKKVLLTFSGDIASFTTSITSENMSINLFFRIIRSCNGVSEQLPGNLNALSFQFEAATPFISDPFYYQICDCNLDCCTDCITYTVQLISPTPIVPVISVAVANVVLSTFISEK